jgi:hypothetical protein
MIPYLQKPLPLPKRYEKEGKKKVEEKKIYKKEQCFCNDTFRGQLKGREKGREGEKRK